MTEWLTTEEAAAYLKVHPKTLYRYVRSGKLRQYNPGGKGHPRFLHEELDALLRGEDAGSPAPSAGSMPEGEVGDVSPPTATQERSGESKAAETAHSGGYRPRESRGFGFGSGFALVPPRSERSRVEALRNVLQRVNDLSRRCEELRELVVKLLDQEQ